jgi:environmental stress-induced protein Ves
MNNDLSFSSKYLSSIFMLCETISSDNFERNQWAGGTTTQLFIYPLQAEYKKRNFSFRISTATVELETSQFTKLPGISRKLMVLEGKMKLVHENQYSKELTKFEVDSFNGDWNTTSQGKCTDFNLMTIGKSQGKLAGLRIKKNKQIEFTVKKSSDWLLIYNYMGEVEIYVNDARYTLRAGDLFIGKEMATSKFQFTGIENSELVIAELWIDSAKKKVSVE